MRELVLATIADQPDIEVVGVILHRKSLPGQRYSHSTLGSCFRRRMSSSTGSSGTIKSEWNAFIPNSVRRNRSASTGLPFGAVILISAAAYGRFSLSRRNCQNCGPGSPADAVACTRPQGGVGCKVWIDQGQSSGGLDDAGSLGPYSPESTSLQPFARAKLSQHRLCSLHPCSEPGRTSARRTLARLREGGMRSA